MHVTNARYTSNYQNNILYIESEYEAEQTRECISYPLFFNFPKSYITPHSLLMGA